MKYYGCRAFTFHNETLVDYAYLDGILTEKEYPEEEEIDITWENLDEVYKKYEGACNFQRWHFNKGRVVSFFDGSFFNKDKRDIKEWKSPLNMKLVIQYREGKPTMAELNRFDAVAAQKYLKEHGA